MEEASHRPLVVVTGAAGLIGQRVAADLARDHRVVGLDRADAPKGWPGVDFLRCDLTDSDDVQRAVAEVAKRHGRSMASVVHLAAWYDFSGAPSPLYQTLTVGGTRHLLRALQPLAVEQFVFSSTILVMRPAPIGSTIAEDSPTEGVWAYPQSKLEAERAIGEERGLIPAVVLRIAGAYDEAGHSPPLCQQMARVWQKDLESLFFPGNARHGQPFVHLDDVVACFRAVVERRPALGPHEVFLVAEPDVVPYATLQERMGELLHGKAWPTLRIPAVVAKAGAWVEDQVSGGKQFIKPWMVDLADAHYPVSIQRARQRLGWSPRHRLLDTLPAMAERLRADPVRWYQDNKLALPDELATERAELRLEQARKTPQQPDLDVPAPPWTHNPSSWRQRVPICLLAGLATVIATYMALYQWRLVDGVWDPVFGTGSERVLDSPTSETMRRWMRMPDAALGALAYLGDLIFGLAGSTRRWQYRPWLVVLFGLDVIPLGIVSAVLVVLQGAVVGWWCLLCLVTAAISLALVLLAWDEVASSLLYLHRVWQRSDHDHRVVWDTFWGRPSEVAEQAALEVSTRPRKPWHHAKPKTDRHLGPTSGARPAGAT